MARWWCRMAVLICAVPVRRICCNGPMRSGRTSARHGRNPEQQTARIDSRGCSQDTAQAFASDFPNQHFPAIHIAPRDERPSHLPVTIMREPFLVMTLRRIPAALAVSAMLCGGASVALAQAPAQAQARPASPKPPKSEAKPSTPKPEAVKPETKPAAAAAGGAEPTLIGQFGT